MLTTTCLNVSVALATLVWAAQSPALRAQHTRPLCACSSVSPINQPKQSTANTRPSPICRHGARRSVTTMRCTTQHVSCSVELTEGDAVSAESTVPDGIALSGAGAAKLMRKIDWHVLPMLFIVYVVAFLDRLVQGHLYRGCSWH